MNQHLIYDSDGTNSSERRTFFVDTDKVVVRAAGLEEEVGIYIAVGECYACGPDDLLWEPLVLCGVPVTVSPDNTQIVLSGNGRYALGDPTDSDFELSGDVNVSVEPVDADYEPTPCPEPVEPVEVTGQFNTTAIVEGCVEGSDGTEQALWGVNTSDGSVEWGPVLKSSLPGAVTCCDDDVQACWRFTGFDSVAPSLWTAGDSSTYTVNGTDIVVDSTLTFDGVNVSTGYVAVQDYVNSLDGWSMEVDEEFVTDGPDTGTDGKPTWRVSYSGPAPATLTISKSSSGVDVYVFTVNADGTTEESMTRDGTSFVGFSGDQTLLERC